MSFSLKFSLSHSFCLNETQRFARTSTSMIIVPSRTAWELTGMLRFPFTSRNNNTNLFTSLPLHICFNNFLSRVKETSVSVREKEMELIRQGAAFVVTETETRKIYCVLRYKSHLEPADVTSEEKIVPMVSATVIDSLPTNLRDYRLNISKSTHWL